ncbi:MAG: hypothetical protein KKB30_02910 [Proteobacteria bacterium]|nr:hypothetical protein [Pseudomonadota bacterium]MBU1716707.1 hypothetical protein [Pseudomonadota bacterium]
MSGKRAIYVLGAGFFFIFGCGGGSSSSDGAINLAPVWQDFTVDLTEDESGRTVPAATDDNPDDSLAYAGLLDSVTINTDGSITLQENYCGTTTGEVSVSDGTETTTVNATVNVTCVDDPAAGISASLTPSLITSDSTPAGTCTALDIDGGTSMQYKWQLDGVDQGPLAEYNLPVSYAGTLVAGTELGFYCAADNVVSNVFVTSVKDVSPQAINFAVMMHLESQLNFITDLSSLQRYNNTLQRVIDTFAAYGAKITIESEKAYPRLAIDYGQETLLNYALANKQGVGTHCDIGTTGSTQELTEQYRTNKSVVDAIVGEDNNLGCSGGWGPNDFLGAAGDAGFSYLDAPVLLAYQSIPVDERPINPDTGSNFTDEEIAVMSGKYFHDPLPVTTPDRFYPKRLSTIVQEAPVGEGIVLLTGSLGEWATLSEGRKNCQEPSSDCKLDDHDVNYIMSQIEIFNGQKEPTTVNLMYFHMPILEFYMPPTQDQAFAILESWLGQMQEKVSDGTIQWVTMKEAYEKFVLAE